MPTAVTSLSSRSCSLEECRVGMAGQRAANGDCATVMAGPSPYCAACCRLIFNWRCSGVKGAEQGSITPSGLAEISFPRGCTRAPSNKTLPDSFQVVSTSCRQPCNPRSPNPMAEAAVHGPANVELPVCGVCENKPPSRAVRVTFSCGEGRGERAVRRHFAMGLCGTPLLRSRWRCHVEGLASTRSAACLALWRRSHIPHGLP